MSKAKPQYLTTFYTNECQLEKREVVLSKESWDKLDELSKTCVSELHRNNNNFITWVLEHYLFLCRHIELLDKGVLPDGVEIIDERIETRGKITLSYKGGATPVEGDDTPYIKTVGIPKPKN